MATFVPALGSADPDGALVKAVIPARNLESEFRLLV
jgi:hypothetical protein